MQMNAIEGMINQKISYNVYSFENSTDFLHKRFDIWS